MNAPEYKSSQSKEPLPLRHRADSIRALHEFAFSLNTSSALGFALLDYISTNQASTMPASDLTYYFLRSAFRINDLLHLPSTTPVSTDAVAREFPSRWSQVGEEFLILATVFGAAAFLLFLLRLVAGTSAYQLILGRVAGLTALFALPVCYLYSANLIWKRASGRLSMGPYTFWLSVPQIFLGAEILCLGILFAMYRKRSIPDWTSRGLLCVHYAFWVFVLWPEDRVSLYRLYAPYLLVLAFPLSGILWLRYLRSEFHGAETRPVRSVGKWALATAITAIAALLYVWLPEKGYDFRHPKNMNSLIIQMSRGPCFGSCPSYTITIHGDGLVEYAGGRHVKVQGSQTGVVSKEQIVDILASLDRAKLWSLEDRAFAWCFDSDSVSVSVSIDVETKRVVSDGGCTGAKSGLQARFVQSAAEIDKIVGSDKWVSCDGPCWK